jgi:tetratricopeptide (TPR) repeat protein
MNRAAVALLGLWLLAACGTTPLERGERLYREGDRLGALETWRSVPESDAHYDDARRRIEALELESQRLALRYRKRAQYFEEKGRLAESILDYRLALRLKPDDAETLSRVQQLARDLARQKAQLAMSYGEAVGAGDLAGARRTLTELRRLDAFDPELQSDERNLRAALRAEVARRLESSQRALSAARYDVARSELDALLELDPNNESARGYLAYIRAVENASPSPARFDAPEHLSSDAEIRAEGFYQNALAAEQANDVYGAIRHDQRALREDPSHERARLHLAHLRAALSDRVEPLIEAGREAFQKEDLQTALDYWRLALLIAPENERTQAYVARAERQLANLEGLRSEPDVAADR